MITFLSYKLSETFENNERVENDLKKFYDGF